MRRKYNLQLNSHSELKSTTSSIPFNVHDFFPKAEMYLKVAIYAYTLNVTPVAPHNPCTMTTCSALIDMGCVHPNVLYMAMVLCDRIT